MHRKLLLIYLFMLPVLFPLRGNETDTLKLEEVIVSAEHSPAIYSRLSRIVNVIGPEEIRRIPAGNIQEILEYVTTIDIRQRLTPDRCQLTFRLDT